MTENNTSSELTADKDGVSANEAPQPLPNGESYGQMTPEEKEEFIRLENEKKLTLMRLGQLELTKSTLLGQFNRQNRMSETFLSRIAAEKGIPQGTPFRLEGDFSLVSTANVENSSPAE